MSSIMKGGTDVDATVSADGSTSATVQNQIVFDPHLPLNLSHTTVKSITFAGKRLPPEKTFWNPLKEEVVREAAKTMPRDSLFEIISCNKFDGFKEGGGYKFIAEANISIQVQDANGAWATTYALLRAMKASIEIIFEWQNNQKAAEPGKQAIISF